MIENVYCSSCKIPVILNRIFKKTNFRDSFSRSTQMSNFMKIRPVGAEIYADEEDRQT